MSAPVFLHPEAGTADPGDTLVLTGPEARHAATVRRIRPGETVELVDGAGARARGAVEAAQPERLEVRVESVDRDADRPLVLVQALAKGGRDEQAVESATELGATRVIPWESQRAVVRWRGPKAQKGRASWEALVRSAVKQSRRALIPTVDPPHSTPALAAAVAAATAAGATVIVLHEEAEQAFARLPWQPEDGGPSREAELWFIVGPEGGIAPDELAALTAAGARAARLGPHVLRASSAGPAAIAAAHTLAGEWG